MFAIGLALFAIGIMLYLFVDEDEDEDEEHIDVFPTIALFFGIMCMVISLVVISWESLP